MKDNKYLERAFQKAEERQREQLDLEIFLAGPFIDPSTPPESGSQYVAHRARFNLHQRITAEFGITPSLGEDEGLIISGKKLLQAEASVDVIEFDFLSDSHCIILLPSSPGSFCELGLFAIRQDYCAKMLLIVDKKYENPEAPGYIHLGPLKTAAHYNATVKYIDYEDHESLWKETRQFIDKMLSRKIMKKKLGN